MEYQYLFGEAKVRWRNEKQEIIVYADYKITVPSSKI